MLSLVGAHQHSFTMSFTSGGIGDRGKERNLLVVCALFSIEESEKKPPCIPYS